MLYAQKQDNGTVILHGRALDETWVEFTLPDGETDESNLTWIDTPLPVVDDVKIEAKARDAFKVERTALVENLEITYNAVVYQADETSQDRMSRAINALPDDTTELPWTAKDNSVIMPTRVVFKAMLLQAGLAQSAIWTQ